MKTENLKRYVVTNDGKKHAVTGEDGKYWICGKVQFRKADPEYELVEEKVTEEKPKKKASSKKKEKNPDEGFDKMPDVSDILADDFPGKE